MAIFGKNNKYKNMTPADFGVLLINNGESITVVNIANYGMNSSYQNKDERKKSKIRKLKLG